jgi:uncharacterized protein DUF326
LDASFGSLTGEHSARTFVIAAGELLGSVDPQSSLHAQVEARTVSDSLHRGVAAWAARATAGRSKEWEGDTMTHAEEMLQTHPTGAVVKSGALADCIEACSDCAQSCTACADADLGEDDVATLIRCIRLCEDCSDICTATERVVSRQTQFEPELARVIVQACAQSCRLCGDECQRHADHHEHCRVCAEVCRRCEQACEELLSALGAA